MPDGGIRDLPYHAWVLENESRKDESYELLRSELTDNNTKHLKYTSIKIASASKTAETPHSPVK